jgi:formyl-CoA transferase
MLKCKGAHNGTDPDDYVYFTLQANAWAKICERIKKPEWINDPAYNTFEARRDKQFKIFEYVESLLTTMDKHEASAWAAEYDIPCGPVNSMKELAYDPSLRKVKTVVEVDHPDRGAKYLTVGSPCKFSGMNIEVTRSPLLGEHTDDVLKELGYGDADIKRSRGAKAV